MAINNVQTGANEVTKEIIGKEIVTTWADGTVLTEANEATFLGGLYNKNSEAEGGEYFKWATTGAFPVSRLTTIGHLSLQKLANDIDELGLGSILIDTECNLQGNTVTLPECKVIFDAQIINGTLTGDNTIIEDRKVNFPDNTLTLNGSFFGDFETSDTNKKGLLVVPIGFIWSTINLSRFNNYILVIRRSFDLEGETITFPIDLTLRFEGGSINNGKLRGDYTILEGVYNTDCELVGEFSGSAKLSYFSNSDTKIRLWNTCRFDTAVIDKDIYVDVVNRQLGFPENGTLNKNLSLVGENDSIITYKGIGNFDGVGQNSHVIQTYTPDLKLSIKNLKLRSDVDDDPHPNGSWPAPDGEVGWYNAHLFMRFYLTGGDGEAIVYTDNVDFKTVGTAFSATIQGNSHISFYGNNTILDTIVWPCLGSFDSNPDLPSPDEFKTIKECIFSNSFLNGCTFIHCKNSTFKFIDCDCKDYFEITSTTGETYDVEFRRGTLNGGVDNTGGATQQDLNRISGNIVLNGVTSDENISFRRINSVTLNNCKGVLTEFKNNRNLDIYRVREVYFNNTELRMSDAASIIANKVILNHSVIMDIDGDSFESVRAYNVIHIDKEALDIDTNVEWVSNQSTTKIYLERNGDRRLYEFDKNNNVKTTFVPDYDLTLKDKDSAANISIVDSKLQKGSVNKTFTQNDQFTSIYISFDYEFYYFNQRVGIIVDVTDENDLIHTYGFTLNKLAWLYNGDKEVQESGSRNNENLGTGRANILYAGGKVVPLISGSLLNFNDFYNNSIIHSGKLNIKEISVSIRGNENAKVFNPKIVIV